MAKNTLQKLLNAGVQFTEMSRQQAESAVKTMVKAGEVRRSDAEAIIQQLIETGEGGDGPPGRGGPVRGRQAARLAGQACR